MLRACAFILVLVVFWLGLSGLFIPLILVLGVMSVAAIALLSARAGVVDEEGFPIQLVFNALWYWPWLLWQILLSGLTVARIIVSPSLPASPTLTTVRATQRTVAGRTTYANSITLTPGTVSVGVEGDKIHVHALTTAGAQDVEEGAMDRMVSRFEGSRR